MSEMIGKVRINDEDYPGKDLYSDGEVEDELLSIAQNEAPEDFDRVVSERKSWPVMYHFSSVRGNILSWYPVLPTDRVLEIGSGCGAVTSVLAERAASVTCVDLSRKRSLVNAYRNRKSANIEIRLGNFQDVEKKLPCDYDLITLIGVFEYGSGYIRSERPYVDFLKIIGRHLAPGGRILIAIENRLGMKYLAGCREDHTGGYFDGVEDYPGTSYVRTFSRPELEKIFDEAGFTEREFRYPYPDYKFALSIFSDERLPKKGELRNNMVNYDRSRVVLFDEAKAFDSLAEAAEFPMFSNSYFITLGKEETPKPVFVKFSNDRGKRFAIRTEIGGRDSAVRKYAASAEGTEHIWNMAECAEQLREVFSGTRFSVNRCCLEENSIAFDYIDGCTLEEELNRLLQKGEKPFLEALKAYFAELDRTARVLHRTTEGYRRIFGNRLPEKERKAAEVSDVDLVLSNILIGGRGPEERENWTVIDYEWTFPFTIPIDFIKWRVIHYYNAGDGKRSGLEERRLYETAQIDFSDLPYFAEMEEKFQKYIAEGADPLWKLYPDVSDGSTSFSELLSGGSAAGAAVSCMIYCDRGSGFSEEDTIRLRCGEDGTVSAELDASGLRGFRIDPGEKPAAVILDSILFDGHPADRTFFQTNGWTADGIEYAFFEDDPQIICPELPEGAKHITFHLTYSPGGLHEAAAKIAAAKEERIRSLERREKCQKETLERVLQAVEAVKELKSVKTYRTARTKLGKSDPFAAIRPMLRNHEGIHLTLDRRSYQPEGVWLMGWIVDEAYTGESLEVVNASGCVLPVKITRCRREDVKKVLGITDDRAEGFDILIEFHQLQDVPLSLRVENPRGILQVPLDIDPDPQRRSRHRAQVKSGELPDDGPVSREYDDWAMDHAVSEEELLRERRAYLSYSPTVSVVIPLYRTPENYLKELLDSLTGQTYPRIEICLADGSPEAGLGAFIKKNWGADPRVRYRKLTDNLGISGNTNEAVRMSSGDILLFADHDDVLAPSACFRIVQAFNEASDVDIVYTDEDKLTAEGHFLFDPNFKPDFSPDLLCSNNYICHIFAVRRETAEKAGFLKAEFDGAQDYDFILRCTEHARRILHVPEALYHWRAHPDSTAGDPESKLYAYENGRRAVEEHWRRLGVEARVEMTGHLGHYRSVLLVTGEPLVSILMPNRDQLQLLKKAVSSIFSKTAYKNYELLILENGSRSEETFAYYDYLTENYDNVRVLYWKEAFHFSKINNFGAEHARGDYLLLLNNDIEVTSSIWLEEMLGYAMRKDVGCVGAYLLYPDGLIQHTGVAVGIGGTAAHLFGGMDPKDYPGGGRSYSTQDLSAVTGACLMTPKSVYREVGGLDEGFEVAYGDIDYCLKVRRAGLLVVENVYAELIHHESASRGSDGEEDPVKHARFLKEAALLRKKWPAYYRDGDPYYNPNLTLERADFSLR